MSAASHVPWLPWETEFDMCHQVTLRAYLSIKCPSTTTFSRSANALAWRGECGIAIKGNKFHETIKYYRKPAWTQGRPNNERIRLIIATTNKSQWYADPLRNLLLGWLVKRAETFWSTKNKTLSDRPSAAQRKIAHTGASSNGTILRGLPSRYENGGTNSNKALLPFLDIVVLTWKWRKDELRKYCGEYNANEQGIIG